MAGVIINLSGVEPRERYCTYGAYSYRQERPGAGRRGWGQNHEGAIADYLAGGDTASCGVSDLSAAPVHLRPCRPSGEAHHPRQIG